MSDIQQLISQLETGSSDLANCLSISPNLTREERFQLVLADQKFRVRRGEPANCSHYSQLLPWLADEGALQQQLVLSEFSLRLGTEPSAKLLAKFSQEYANSPLISPKQLKAKLEQWNQQSISYAEFDSLCDRFEEGVIAGQSPRIEDWLALAPNASHEKLLVELLRMETYHLQKGGAGLDWQDYQRRFPNFISSIQQVQQQVEQTPKSNERVSRARENPTRQHNPGDLTGTYISQHTVGDLRNGRYRLERKLGQGAYGAVYLAQDKDLKRQVAVKVPSREALDKLVDIESYLHEAQNVAALDHPHIVPVYDVGRTIDGSIYVVSKFIDGCSLSD
jgi:hypothetical protein